MIEEIEVKRKYYQIIEQIGDRSFKVMRKDKLYFLKKFEVITKDLNISLIVNIVYIWGCL